MRLKLTDEHAIDVADASGTLLFDVAARGWSDEVRQGARRRPGVAAEGLRVARGHRRHPRRACPSPPARATRPPARWASGVVAEGGPASVVLGTSGVVFAALDRYAHDPEARVHAFCHAVPQAWHIMGVMLSAAGSLQWLRETVGGTYDELLGGAAEWEPGVEGLLFAPYLAGERTPHADPAARGAFAGLGLRHDRGALARAVLEGVAFALRDALDLVEELGGRPRVGRISGRRRALAAVAGDRRLGARDATRGDRRRRGRRVRRGAAGRRRRRRLGRRARGGVACVGVTRTIEPRAEWIEPYAEARERFRGLYPALRPLQA